MINKLPYDILPSGGVASLNWTPDQQAYAFRRRAEIDPVRKIGNGRNASPMPIALHQISPRWTWKGESMDVDCYLKQERVSGVIVLKDGHVLLERYGLGRTAEDLWDTQSVTKSIAGILVGAAIQDGYIEGVGEAVTKYIPELKGSAYDDVTIRQLLTMTSGVKWVEDYTDDAKSDDSKMFMPATAPMVNGVDPVVRYMRRLSRATNPGATFQYKGGDSELAAKLVSNAVGMSLSEYLSIKIWKPFGMDRSAYWMVNPAGQEYGSTGISMTLRDYARIGQFMLGGGKVGGVQVLPWEWLADATSAQEAFSVATESGATGYGYYWWIGKDFFMANGYAGQRIVVYPEDKTVIAVNSAWEQPNRPEHSPALTAFIEALHAAAVTHTPSLARIEPNRGGQR
ncbi:serine hydrolase domain-containing protein [Rhizobium gallicum]|uniref:serine hydrolase domain-containing protein n=1 Tax=Rhizobium gallicum TaxID=56730 RepID=UPI001EF7BB1A|nr:serine hydrolase [Rhizobium gallicum]ULJ74258.1 beta-lactamase family protein [Rhizobium gallicum]